MSMDKSAQERRWEERIAKLKQQADEEDKRQAAALRDRLRQEYLKRTGLTHMKP